ncbi:MULTISPECIES: UrvD/REP family ATP-dependent DNA helicase [unclassified Frigoribacterium]|uniref:UrvD/REP family ATP-dependent DNA helicase n=1 Tax=unclassified Frigoribacterium TaxID=2627005 RepID=UPI001566EDB3|nr:MULTISPECIES: UrvD/REP family ATP-dependent DNA helicase [unclassified Frigoribacterium]NQW88390.1 ATP-dependent helicase [Frigoribacterium sp. VKM Ac-2860]NQX08801.1 ATP-dependent helicase [Frigoribacterium sp. VKM Ac-2859]
MASTVSPPLSSPARASVPPVLDDSQRAVLDLADGRSAAVLGAPGSGKTRTLVEFVVDRVERRGWGPAAVMVLAPTRSTATTLRDVIASRLTVPTPGPLARTVSSLAFDVVGHAARLVGLPTPTLLTGGDQDSIVRSLLEGHEVDGTGPSWPEGLGPTVRRLRGFRTELREVLMRSTEHRIGSEGLRRAAERADRPEWAAVADFRDEYLSVLDAARGRHLDSADLVDYAVAALDRGETSPVVEGLRVVLVDDAQEATESTLALLRALTRRGVAVVAFGDPDLSTSAFRGGTPDVLGRLGPRLGLSDVETLYLSTAHRHQPPLRDLVQRVTSRIGTAGAGRQHAAVAAPAIEPSEAGGAADPVAVPIVTVRADSPSHEVASVARLLREHHLVRRVPWSRMMVVVRSGGQVAGVARGLQLAEVPTRTSVAGRAVRDEHAARHLLLAAAVAVGRDELTVELATELLLGPLAGFDALSLRRLRLALRADELGTGGVRSADDLLVEALEGAGRFVTIDSRFAARAGRFSTSLDAARRAAATGASIEEVLWGLWERSGLAAEWSAQSDGRGIVAAEADRHLDGVVALFTAAKRFVERTPEAPAGAFLDSLLGAEVPEDTLSPQATAETVLVCSPSNAVGIEVDVVVAARLQDGVWPNLRVRGGLLAPDELVDLAERGLLRGGPMDDHDHDDEPAAPSDARATVLSDELRMFALTVSRATRQVVLSCTSNDDEGPSPFFRLLPDGCPEAPAGHPLSLRGLVGHLRHVLVSAPHGPRADDAVEALARLAGEGVAGASPDDWYGLPDPSTVEPLIDLEAPEAHVPVSPSQLGSFEECPLHWFVDRFGGSPPNAAMGLGTVLHDVMEHAEGTDVDSLWQSVEGRWPELEFESAWIAEAEKRRARDMTESLSSYLRDFEASGGSLLGAESTFSLDIGPARLRGSIDRVERTREGAAVIVDLKTGRSAPTSPQAVAEHPQLGSYQVALADGAVEAVPEGTPPGGAKLVIVSSGVRGKLYREPAQGAFDDDRLAAFRARVVDAAEHMAGRVFVARLDDHCEGRHGGSCRIHVVGEVSGS